MGWWIYLRDETAEPDCSYGQSLDEFEPDYEGDEPCPEPCYPSVTVDRHAEGGTYVLGGTDAAEIAITYNYSQHYYEHLNPEDGLRWLNGRKARDVIPDLERAVSALGQDRAPDYWAPTAGNAGHALSILLCWAKQHPDAVFKVS